MTRHHKPTVLAWLDLETTGLDPADGLILEYGVIITDLELKEIARKSWVLPYDRPELLENLKDDYVLDMHMANGLFKESHTAVSTLPNWQSPLQRREKIHQGVREFIRVKSYIGTTPRIRPPRRLLDPLRSEMDPGEESPTAQGSQLPDARCVELPGRLP